MPVTKGLSALQRVCSSGRLALALLVFIGLIGVLTVVFGITGHRAGSDLKRMEAALQRVNRSVSTETAALRQKETEDLKKLVKLDQAVKHLTEAMDKVKTEVQGKIVTLRNTLRTVNCDVQDIKHNRTASKAACCPAGWDSFSRSCYWVSKAEKPWEEAKVDCEDRDAHLATITSYLEQQFVAQRTKPRDWKPGQPYSHRLGEQRTCAHLHRDGLWNEEHCSRRYNWVCEIDLKG
ncbi:asialoglycoprotein receptor 1-like isoform X2 [Eublepharis macularius]|uniref:Asialoglycoprotein receptor 1-like isoform X2 n=1 Tax=Eublepharis macularius TaxID=481883 RepID=A0AA97K749_EUBMA|nr:asialoglycoprotein receptor 1-like isoform X2 [Eublepharis macularius]